MHILFLSDNFPPEVNAPASRTFEHCREWVKAGHRITVVTCAPNFPKGVVFPGYRNKLWHEEEMDGIRVVRVWTYISANEGFAKRVLDYISFMVSGLMAALAVRKVDLVIGTSPQFFTACAAYMAGLLKRVPWIFELRDLWPESIRVVGAMKGSVILDTLERLELFLYRKARRIVSVTESFRETLVRRGIASSKIHVVTNGVDISRFHPRAKDTELQARHGLRGKFVVGYIGTHGLAHALDTLLDTAARMKAQGNDEVRFLLLGEGAAKAALMKRAAEARLSNVVFLDSVPKEDVPRYWALLDAAVVHLRKSPLFTTVIPSKIFEAMAMGIPLLHGVQGESAAIVEREQAGICFEPEDAGALEWAILRLMREPELLASLQRNGPVAAQKYTRTALALDMLRIIEATCAGPDASQVITGLGNGSTSDSP